MNSGLRFLAGIFALLVVAVIASCSVATPPAIQIVPDGSVIVAGETLQLVATRHYPDGTVEDVSKIVDWSTSDPTSLKLVSPELSPGLVMATNPTASVFVTATDPDSGATVTSTFSVSQSELRRIDLNPAIAISLIPGLSRNVSAIGTYSDGTTLDITTTVLWSSSNEAVAAVSNLQGQRGTVTAISPGNTNITAEDGLTGIIGSTLVFVSGEKALKAIQIIPNPASIAVGATNQYAATGVYSDGTTADLTHQVTWASSKTTVASVDMNGLALGIAAGDTTITASEPATAIRASALLTVTP